MDSNNIAMPQKRKAGDTLKEVKKKKQMRSNIIKTARTKHLQYTNWKGNITNPIESSFDCK